MAKALKTLLKVVKGKDQGNEFMLYPQETYDVGRGSKAKIRLQDQTVSHQHARLQNVGGIWFVQDLGSRHGTSVNKQRIESRKALFDRDTIRVGKTLMEFREFEDVEQDVVDEADVAFRLKEE